MGVIDRYVAVHVIRSVVWLAMVLVLLFVLILLVEELDDVGTGRYTWLLAMKYSLLQSPKLLLELATFVGLVGSILALGGLAGHNEIVAMQSIGMHSRRVLLPVMMATVFLMVLILINAQYVLPTALRLAHIEKTLATEGFGDSFTASGYWSQDGGTFLHVRKVEQGRIPTDIQIYEFAPDYDIRRHIQAQSAIVETGRDWWLQDVLIKNFADTGEQQLELDGVSWTSFLSAEQLGVVLTPPESLSLADLYHFVQGLKQRKEQSYRYELIFWQRLMIPFATMLMILIGARFVFGSTRQTTAGKRITVAVLVGLAFYFASQAIYHLGQLFAVAPLLTASLPLLCMGLLLLALNRNSAV